MNTENGFFPGKTIRVYPEENAIGFVFASEEWARKFYLETILRGQKHFRLEGDEVIRQVKSGSSCDRTS